MIELNSKTPIILYGAASRGSVFFEILHQRCNIIGFIDKRADEILLFKDLPVLSANDYYLNSYKKTAVVIVCVSNIFEHERIAMHLANLGYYYILFCPVNRSNILYRSKAERDILSQIHESLLNGEFVIPCHVPSIRGLLSIKLDDCAIVSRVNDRILARVPAPFAFTRLVGNGRFQDSPILTLFPFLEVYDYYNGLDGIGYRNYLDLYCRDAAVSMGVTPTLSWESNVISARREVYERMKQSDEIDPDFLRNLAVPATWNSTGAYFNMQSGKHRAIYLIHRRRQYIPLTISADDYDIFLNQSVVSLLEKYFIETGTYETPYPVLHPVLMNFAFATKSNFYNLLLDFSRWIVTNAYRLYKVVNLSGLSLLSTTDIFEPVVQFLAKFGVDINVDYPISDFDVLVRKLYWLDGIGVNKESSYDIMMFEYGTSQTVDYSAPLFCILFEPDYRDEVSKKFNIEKLYNYQSKKVAFATRW